MPTLAGWRGTATATLLLSIDDIVVVRPEKKVARVYAGAVVAAVQNVKPGGNGPSLQRVYDPMSEPGSYRSVAGPRDGSGPLPAATVVKHGLHALPKVYPHA